MMLKKKIENEKLVLTGSTQQADSNEYNNMFSCRNKQKFYLQSQNTFEHAMIWFAKYIFAQENHCHLYLVRMNVM